MVMGEDKAENRRDSVEARALVRKRLAVSDVEVDLEPRLPGGQPSLLDLVGRDVEPNDLGSGTSREKRNTTGPAGEVQDPLARLEVQLGGHALVNRGKGGGDALVGRTAPDRCSRGHPSSCFASS